MFYPLWDWDATCAALSKVFSLIPCKAWMMEKGAYFLRLGSLNNSTEREALLEWPLELLPYIHEGNLKKIGAFLFSKPSHSIHTHSKSKKHTLGSRSIVRDGSWRKFMTVMDLGGNAVAEISHARLIPFALTYLVSHTNNTDGKAR